MKNIAAELTHNIRLLEIEETEEEMFKDSSISKARELLKEAIIGQDYSPNSIRIITDRVVVRKKETTVRFRLKPQGYQVKQKKWGEDYFTEPRVVVHIFEDGTHNIYNLSLIKALEMLVNPYYWQIEKTREEHHGIKCKG